MGRARDVGETDIPHSEQLDDLAGRMKEAVDQTARAPARDTRGEVPTAPGLMGEGAEKNNHKQSEHAPGPLGNC